MLSFDFLSSQFLAAGEGLGLRTLVDFLLGSRDAFQQVAHDRAAIWVGGTFVIAAGLAREYARRDLRRQWPHLLLPFAASMMLAMALYVVAYVDRFSPGSVWPGYRSFLATFWFAAPMAMLYGVPYAKFLSPRGAMRASLWTLALISVWRVLLISRVIAVLTGREFGPSLLLVLMVADTAAAIVLLVAPMPVVRGMGGIVLSDRDGLLASIGCLARGLTILTLPLWIVLGISNFTYAAAPPAFVGPSAWPTWPLLMAALVCVIVWLLALPSAQRRQRLARAADDLFLSGSITEGFAFLSRHAPGDFPPAYEPPPRMGWKHCESPFILDAIEHLNGDAIAKWVRAIFIEKFERQYLSTGFSLAPWIGQQEWDRVEILLRDLPEGPYLASANQKHLNRIREKIAMHGKQIDAHLEGAQ